jgi:HSP20 family protein
MALVRRPRETAEGRFGPGVGWPFSGGLLDWPPAGLDALRRLAEDEVKVEEFTEDGELVVRAELPGVDPDKDVDISVVDGNLCIRAERRHEEREEHRDYRRTELRYGSFSRVLPLPPQAKESDIHATYGDGILEVRAPLDEEAAKPSKIPISRG